MRNENGTVRYSPSDLVGFLGCPHLTTLDLEVARGELERPFRHNPHADLIRRKGNEHEARYLASLGEQVVRIDDPREIGWDEAAARTERAVRAGVAVIYQAALAEGLWRGLADFLERRPEGGYEVVDTKLARRAKPNHVLQLCFYTEQVARIQGEWPKQMHVVNGLGERETFRPDEFLAYYNRLKRRFLAATESDRPTEPYPVDNCSFCDFLELCKRRWRDEDHLSLVAGIRRTQVDRLDEGGIRTLEALATTAQTKVPKLRSDTLAKLHKQAALQLHRRQTGELKHILLPIEPERGFSLLPEPSPGDIWLDFEGDPWYEPGRGLEYLFGWVYLDDDGATRYEAIWALDRDAEKAGFERLLDLICERRRRFPGMHVYHYAPYERTALQRLMGEHGTREERLDDLLRGEVLVDLYRVTRQALRLSLESYSIKEVEAFYAFERAVDVGGGGGATVAFEEWLEAREQSILDSIVAYNEEDCRSLYELHRWLLELRPPEVEWRAAPEEREVREETKELLEERARAEAELLATGVPEDELLAHLLEYHRREEKPQWWEFFHHKGLDEEELLEDTDTIGGLELDRDPEPDKNSFVYTFSFPAQEHKIGGEAIDPATEVQYTVTVDDERGLVSFRRAQKRAEEPLPCALIPPRPLHTRVQREAVLRFAQNRQRYPALQQILERRKPRARLDGTLEDSALSLEESYLFVQGPPGSGKTWNGARMAIALMKAGRRVGVTALSHKAIHKFLEDVESAAVEMGYSFRGLKKSGSGEGSWYEGRGLVKSTDDYDELLEDDVQLLAGTSWAFSREELDHHLDTLFIDEGGQFALADALAVGTAARNLILLGDPNQLAQVSQGAHPPGANASVLSHLLGEDETVREGMGRFLPLTWRMRPEVNDFISSTFYEGRLEPAPVCFERSLAVGNGIRYTPLEHGYHRVQSPEEAEFVRDEIKRLLGTPYTDGHGERPLAPEDIVVVSPFNAHVRCLRQHIPDQRIRIGTVDKFQGQQAAVVFYSMASSSSEDVPRGLDFLFSRNRLNVAISRAKCLAYLVASPRLLDANCRTVEQMRLANALCRLVEVAA